MKPERYWKYTEDERPVAECYDCGLDYGSDTWVDVIVPDDIWELINPTYYRGAGLLCFNCMVRRLQFLGLEDVPMKIASGPFIIGKLGWAESEK